MALARCCPALLVVAALSACSSRRPVATPAPSEAQEALEVTLERTACFGTCPVYTLAVTSNGVARWLGTAYVGLEGVDAVRLTPAQVDELRDAWLRARLTKTVLAGNCVEGWATDHASVKVRVKLGGTELRYVHDLGCHGDAEMDRLARFADEVDRIVGTNRWIGSSEAAGADRPSAN